MNSLNKSKSIILASTSKYRKELLSRLGIIFETVSPDLDEEPFKAKIQDLSVLAQTLGFEKANTLKSHYPDSIIIGSDQIAECDGKRLGKPLTKEKAFETLNFLNAKDHRLITSFTVLYKEEVFTHTNITRLKMRKLNEAQISHYIEADNPLDCAGSYKLELSGISLFEEIQTDDHTAIVGLPLIELTNILINIGVAIPPRK